jgi:hypothetical protein
MNVIEGDWGKELGDGGLTLTHLDLGSEVLHDGADELGFVGGEGCVGGGAGGGGVGCVFHGGGDFLFLALVLEYCFWCGRGMLSVSVCEVGALRR